MSSSERTLRRAEIQASLNAKTFRPKHGGGKTLAELEAVEDAEAQAFAAVGLTIREMYEDEWFRLPFSARESLRGDLERGTLILKPGARPK